MARPLTCGGRPPTPWIGRRRHAPRRRRRRQAHALPPSHARHHPFVAPRDRSLWPGRRRAGPARPQHRYPCRRPARGTEGQRRDRDAGRRRLPHRDAGRRRLWQDRRAAGGGGMSAKEEAVKGGKRSIVSSAHLVSERAAETRAFEYGLYLRSNAFNRWIVRCMAAAGYPDLAALDVMVLHSVNHRARDTKLADICFVLNIQDSHTVNSALQTLTRAGPVAGDKSGKQR